MVAVNMVGVVLGEWEMMVTLEMAMKEESIVGMGRQW